MHPATYRAKINAAIKHLGVKVMACAHNGGYSYFVNLKTDEQVGESVGVYRQCQLSIVKWVESASLEVAREKLKQEDLAFSARA